MADATCSKCGHTTNSAVSEYDPVTEKSDGCYLRWKDEKPEQGCFFPALLEKARSGAALDLAEAVNLKAVSGMLGLGLKIEVLTNKRDGSTRKEST